MNVSRLSVLFIVSSSLFQGSTSFGLEGKQAKKALVVGTSSSSVRQTNFKPLQVGYALDFNNDEDEFALMQKAMTCATSDVCSLEDTQVCLDNVIQIQSGCASGTLVGNAVCENVDATAELVANLREKIQQKTNQLRAIALSTNVVNVGLVGFFLALFASGLALSDPSATPFTPEEWWWSIRDGYFLTMLQHYYRHGGLVNYDTTEIEAVSFTLQEWWWAVRDGYVPTIMSHYFHNGGLASSAEFGPVEAAPLTPQEWLWAVQGGYISDLVSHNFQHGGIASAAAAATESGDGAVPLTLQEWVWAAKHNYLGSMTEKYIQKGGF